ncbi:MAG: hypothetical protein P8M78_03605 [Myxococcota bacterium]|nr:hypothetical protein [Myxococcota bacterium]
MKSKIGTSLALSALMMTACAHSRVPTQLQGEIERFGTEYIVTQCSTGKTYQLKMIPHAFVALDRNVRTVQNESGGPVFVELGGKILPATSDTAAEAIFDVHDRYAVRQGRCP